MVLAPVAPEPNAASQGGVNDVFAKIWLADGNTAQPPGWQLTWDYTPAFGSPCTGFAGITAGSGGITEFDVDYFLVKAAGLPVIQVMSGASVPISAATPSYPAPGTPCPPCRAWKSTLIRG